MKSFCFVLLIVLSIETSYADALCPEGYVESFSGTIVGMSVTTESCGYRKDVSVNGDIITETYSASDHVYIIEKQYNENGDVVAETLSRKTSNNRLIDYTEATATYDNRHNILTNQRSSIDGSGSSYTYSYDASNNIIAFGTIYYKANHEIWYSLDRSYGFDEQNREISYEEKQYDKNHNLTFVEKTTTEYDTNGNIIGGDQWYYDGKGNPTYFGDANSDYYYEYTYDENGNATGGQKTDDDGNILETYRFDEMGYRLICATDDENCSQPSAKYGAFGELIESYQYDSNGKKTTYDKYGRKINIGKRIYTVEEAEKVSKKTGNTFRLRYK